MTRVIVPLAKPAIAAVALFNFLYAWNDFFAPLLYVGEDSSRAGPSRSGCPSSRRCTTCSGT